MYESLYFGPWSPTSPSSSPRAAVTSYPQETLLDPVVTRPVLKSCLTGKRKKKAKNVQWDPSVIFNERSSSPRRIVLVVPPSPTTPAKRPAAAVAAQPRDSARRVLAKPPAKSTKCEASSGRNVTTPQKKELPDHSTAVVKGNKPKLYVPPPPPPSSRLVAAQPKAIEKGTKPQPHLKKKQKEGHNHYQVPPPAPMPPRRREPPAAPRPTRLPTPDLPEIGTDFFLPHHEVRTMAIQATQVMMKIESQSKIHSTLL